MLKKYIQCLLIAILLVSTGTVIAQNKTGYINLQLLISSMPEVKTAYDSLQKYATSLQADGQSLVTEYEKRIKDFSDHAADMKADLKAIKTKELQTAQTNIEEYKARMEQSISAMEQALMAPLLSKAKKAINTVATEKGYNFVIDNSREILLMAPPTDNLMEAVKLKLSIK